jgi:biotin-[acetyl-CoA-carboxylase] ligase BirA-like protein
MHYTWQSFKSLPSTNAYCLNYPIVLPWHHGYVCHAYHQTSGYGQYDRTWHSTPCSITLSVLWHGAITPGLSVWVGLTLVHWLRTMYYLPIYLKWPNDLMLDDQKIGGILIETTQKLPQHVTVGVGLNVYKTTLQPFSSLALCPISVPYHAFSIGLAEAILHTLYHDQTLLYPVWWEKWHYSAPCYLCDKPQDYYKIHQLSSEGFLGIQHIKTQRVTWVTTSRSLRWCHDTHHHSHVKK